MNPGDLIQYSADMAGGAVVYSHARLDRKKIVEVDVGSVVGEASLGIVISLYDNNNPVRLLYLLAPNVAGWDTVTGWSVVR